MFELYLFLVFMIVAAIIAIEIKDLMAAVVAVGAVGFSVAIMFILLQAPDLAIVQIVVETLTVVIFAAVVLRTTHIDETIAQRRSPLQIFSIVIFFLFGIVFLVASYRVIKELPAFGFPIMRVANDYIRLGLGQSGGANIIADIILDFRGLDTLGEATVLFTSVMGVLAIMRKRGRYE